MHLFKTAAAVLVVAPLAVASGSAMAASAHNSQAGSYGDSQNATASTPSSPRVKHAAKHKAMHKAM